MSFKSSCKSIDFLLADSVWRKRKDGVYINIKDSLHPFANMTDEEAQKMYDETCGQGKVNLRKTLDELFSVKDKGSYINVTCNFSTRSLEKRKLFVKKCKHDDGLSYIFVTLLKKLPL